MTQRDPHRAVGVIALTGAPRLARLVADIEAQLLKPIQTLPTDALRHLLRVGAEITRARGEYERFRQRLGVQRKTNAGRDS